MLRTDRAGRFGSLRASSPYLFFAQLYRATAPVLVSTPL